MARRIAVLALATGLAGGGLIGGMFGIPGISGAQSTTTTTPAAPASPATPSAPDQGRGSGSWTSNEDPAHEVGESPEREAQEDSGQFRGHRHGSNEDPGHEADESPEREAQEDAGNGGPSSPSSSTSGSSTSSGQT
jgi:hypothetical protein